MLLRKKILYAFCLMVSIFLIFNFGFYFVYFKGVLSKLWKIKIDEDIKRIEKFFNYEKEQLMNLTKDWAAWTEAYLFMQGMNPDFRQVNLGVETYINNKLNLIAYVNLRGDIIAGGFYDLSTNKVKNLDEKILKKYIQRYFSFPRRVNFVSILKEKNYFMLIAVHPVVKSDFKGPAVGYLFMGRVISSEMENFMRSLLGFDEVRLTSVSPSLPDLFIDSKSSSYKITYKLEDFFGKRDIALYFETSDKKMEVFKNSLIFLLQVYIVTLLGFSGFVFYLVNKRILNRIENITKSLHDIKRERMQGLEVDGDDEIGYLISEMNNFCREIRNATLKSQQNERIFKTVSDKLDDVVIVIDSEGKIIYSNPKAQNLMRISEKINRLPYRVITMSEEQLEEEEEIELEDRRYLRLKKIIVQQEPKIILIIGEDITVMKKEKERLMDIALKDDLTSLYNRYYFEKVLQEKINLAKMGEKYSLIFVTIDNLRKINEENGRMVGDFVVKSVANIISKNLKSGDIAARWSGSRFGIIIKGDSSRAKYLEEKIKKLQEVSLEFEGQIVPLIIEVKVFTIDGEKDLQTLIKEAISK